MTAAPARPAADRTLRTVELGRGLAALAVVVFHANASAPHFGGPRARWPSAGEHGVDFFFVLSGFIIYHASRHQIGCPGAVRDYVLKRVIRLVPLLWLVVLGWSLLCAIAGVVPDTAMILRSLFLWPSLAPTVPLVVWTLRHEVLFYFAFAIMLVSPRLGRLVFTAWPLAVVAQAIAILAGTPLRGWASLAVSAYVFDFLIGMAVAVAYARGLVRPGWAILILATAAVVIVLVAEEALGIGRTGMTDYVSPAAAWWTPLLGLAFAGLLWGLLAIETLVRVPRWGLLLGAASYAIYLIHIPANSIAQRLAVHLPRGVLALGGGQALLIVAGVAAGILVHVLAEKPVTRALRNRLLPRAGPRGDPRA